MRGIFTRIRVRILSIVLLAVIPAIGLIWYSADARKRQISEEIESNAMRLSRFLASNLERDLLHAEGYLRSVAGNFDFRNLRSDSCGRALAGLLGNSTVYANLGVVEAGGAVLCSAAPLPKTSGLEKLEWFQKAWMPGSLAVGFDYKGILSHQASINLGMALPEGYARKGDILFAVMDLEWLTRLAEKSQLPPGSALSVTNRRGDAVVRYPDPDKWVGKPYPQALLQESRLAEGEGVRIAKGIDGVERLYAFSAVKGNGNFVVQIGIRREEAYAPANRILYRQLAALGLVALLAILMAWFGADVFLLKQVNALIDATRRLAGGDLTARSTLSYDRGELGDLARAFDDMAEKLEWREAQLRESETERADPISHVPDFLELIPQAVLLVDGDHRIEAANREARKLFGFEDGDLTGRPLNGIVPMELPPGPSFPSGDNAVRAPGAIETSGRRKDGTDFPVEILYTNSLLNRRMVSLVMVREKPTELARKSK
jgi:PAS domain S-box-containing protein